jgi:undecaprenyl diphosphate synthase
MSNFLLWQTAYAVRYVAQNYWPAISEDDIQTLIRYYNQVMATTE